MAEELEKIMVYLNDNLSNIDLQLFVNQYSSINKFCEDKFNSTLLYRYLTNTLLFTFFESKLNIKYSNNIIIENLEFIQKKINGKPNGFLNLTDNEKNDDVEETYDVEEIPEYFQYHILIINLKSEKWWKHKKNSNNINYNNIIEAGIYIINKDYCNKNIKIENKKISLNNMCLYRMLTNSIESDLYIRFPNKSGKILDFNIVNAFV